MRAEFTVLEQHIAHPLRPDGPELFGDSVGIGCYRIDLHPRVSGAGYLDLGCWPFQIPLGAMIPVRVENLLPGGKNLGVTHITNGAFRVHPVEWNVGEAAGTPGGVLPRTQASRRGPSGIEPELLEEFQSLLRRRGRRALLAIARRPCEVLMDTTDEATANRHLGLVRRHEPRRRGDPRGDPRPSCGRPFAADITVFSRNPADTLATARGRARHLGPRR